MDMFQRHVVSVLGMLAAGSVVLSGCKTTETYTIYSYSHSPETVTLTNTVTREVVWTCDVPVGQKVDIRFEQRADHAEEQGFDTMYWTVSGVATDASGRKNSLKVPPPSQRILEHKLRAIPEAQKK